MSKNKDIPSSSEVNQEARNKIERFVEEYFPDESFLLADGFEKAFIGIAYGMQQESTACYDRDKCIQILEDQGMSHEEAEEFFGFNVEGAYVGTKTPTFLFGFRP